MATVTRPYTIIEKRSTESPPSSLTESLSLDGVGDACSFWFFTEETFEASYPLFICLQLNILEQPSLY